MEVPIDYVWFYLKSILIGHLNHSNRIRNEQIMAKIRKLVRTGKAEQGVPVHSLMCTGTHWPKMTRTQSVPVQVQSVPVQVSEKCLKCVFSPIFHALFHPKPNLYFIYTSKSFQIHLVSSVILKSSFNGYLSSKFFHEFLQNHSNMGYDPYTNQVPRFVRVCSKP